MNELVDLPVERRGHLRLLELHGEAADPLEGAAAQEEDHREGPHPHRHEEEDAVARAQHVRAVLAGRAPGLPRRAAATAQDLTGEEMLRVRVNLMLKYTHITKLKLVKCNTNTLTFNRESELSCIISYHLYLS